MSTESKGAGKRGVPLPSVEKVQQELGRAEGIDDFFGKEGIFARLFAETLEQMLEAELTDQLGYEKYEAKGRNSGNSRNGQTKRNWRTSNGDLEIEVPRDRNGEYQSKVLAKHQTSTNELEAKILALYAKGLSTRDIQATLEDLYGVEVSPTTISTITDKVWSLVEAWQNRALAAIYPIVYLDALRLKLRRDGKVVNTAVYVVLGVDLEGQRDVLGHWLGDGGEGANFWLSVVSDLQARGRGHLRGLYRRAERLQGRHPGGLPADGHPTVRDSPDPSEPEICWLEGPQSLRRGPESHLPRPDARSRRKRASDLRRALGSAVCSGGAFLGSQLGRPGDDVCLSRCHPAPDLHHQYRRGLSSSTAQGLEDLGLVPDRGGCPQVALPRHRGHFAQVDGTDFHLAADPEPARHSL